VTGYVNYIYREVFIFNTKLGSCLMDNVALIFIGGGVATSSTMIDLRPKL